MKYSEYAWLCNELYEDDSPGRMTVDDLVFSVQRRGDDTVIGFRGSWNVENWLRDLDCRIITNRHGRQVHAGFWGAFEKMWPVIMPLIPKHGRIISYGHSLGGTSAAYLSDEIGCYAVTFGCPMPYAMGQVFPKQRHFRVVCDDDPVPELPALGYSHYCVPSLVLESPGAYLNPEDHSIGVYIDRLTARGL